MEEQTQLLGQCVACKTTVNNFATHWKCAGKCKALMCEDCVLNEERHPHEMIKVKGERRELLHFEYRDKKRTGNILYLSEYTCAIPGSVTLAAKNIKSVLSVMDFESSNLKHLREVYYPKGKPYKQTSVVQGVVYHHVPVPDYRDPAQLSTTKYTLPDLLCETTSYIDEALKHGNVLLHCQLGQRRSPTILTAWFVTRGLSVEKAIDFISDHYVNQKNWGNSYRKERSKWISKLQAFKKKHPELRKYWRKSHVDLMKSWDNTYDELEANVSESAEEPSQSAGKPAPAVAEKQKEAPKVIEVAKPESSEESEENLSAKSSNSKEEENGEEKEPESNKENQEDSEAPDDKREIRKVTDPVVPVGKNSKAQTSLSNFFAVNPNKRKRGDDAELPNTKKRKN